MYVCMYLDETLISPVFSVVQSDLLKHLQPSAHLMPGFAGASAHLPRTGVGVQGRAGAVLKLRILLQGSLYRISLCQGFIWRDWELRAEAASSLVNSSCRSLFGEGVPPLRIPSSKSANCQAIPRLRAPLSIEPQDDYCGSFRASGEHLPWRSEDDLGCLGTKEI